MVSFGKLSNQIFNKVQLLSQNTHLQPKTAETGG